MSAGRALGLIYEEGAQIAIPNAASGTATIPNVKTQYPFPLPDGTYVAQSIDVGYEIFGANIHLTNIPKEGNYYFWLHVKVTEPDRADCDD